MRITLKLLGPYAEVAIISIIISRASRNGIILVVEQAVEHQNNKYLFFFVKSYSRLKSPMIYQLS